MEESTSFEWNRLPNRSSDAYRTMTCISQLVEYLLSSAQFLGKTRDWVSDPAKIDTSGGKHCESSNAHGVKTYISWLIEHS